MNRRPHLTLVALIAAGLIGVGLLAVPGSPIEQTPTLRLDLQGVLEVTLKAVPPVNRPLQKTDLDLENVKNLGEKSIDEIKTALASLGLSLGMRIDPNVLGTLGRGGAK